MMTPISNLPIPNTGSGDSAAASEPGDLLSAEFAAMFASLCAAQPVTPPVTSEVPAEGATSGIELATSQTESPCGLTTTDPKTGLPAADFAPPVVGSPILTDEVPVEGESLPQSPTTSIAYDRDAAPEKGTIVTPRQVQNASDLVFKKPLPIVPPIHEKPSLKPAVPTSEEPLILQSKTTVPVAPPVTPEAEKAEVVTTPDAPAHETPNIDLPNTPVKPVAVPTVDPKGRAIPISNELVKQNGKTEIDVDDAEVDEKVEAGEPLNLKTQTEATKRISGLIATYLIEGARSGSTTTARFAGLEFELDLDPSARQKRQSTKLDSKGIDFSLRMRPFSDLIADSVAAPTEMSPVAQVSQKVIELAKTSTRELESLNFKLNPEELGEVELQLTRHKDGSISAHLTTERESARAALTRTVDELRQTLEQAGVQVAKLQVSTSTTSMDQHRHHDRDASANSASSARTGNNTTSNSNEPEASTNSLADNNRLLSLRA